MAASPTSGNEYPVGLRYGSVFALTSIGLLAGNSATVPYEGLPFTGANAFNMTYPDPRKIDHPGDDRVMATDYLPPIEAATATIEVSRDDMTLNAFLTGVTSFTSLDQRMMTWGTDSQGDEPTVALFLYQQSLSGAAKVRNWRWYIFPSCRCIPKPTGMTASQTNLAYNVVLNPTTNLIWGTALTTGTQGALEHTILEGHSAGQPWLAAWIGAGASATKYPFSATKQAASIIKISLWHTTSAGVATDVSSAGATFEVSGPTITASIPATSIITSLYELA